VTQSYGPTAIFNGYGCQAAKKKHHIDSFIDSFINLFIDSLTAWTYPGRFYLIVFFIKGIIYMNKNKALLLSA